MILGQTNSREKLHRRKSSFILIVGERGSGKKTILRETYGDSAYWVPDISVDSIRTMIKEAYKVHDTMFIIADADNMSLTAKNALLKVVEECPNNNWFIMTLQDANNTLETIRSRAEILYVDLYTEEELNEYYLHKYANKETAEKLYVCSTPGEVDIFEKQGGIEFYEYVETVVDCIDEVSLANALKIGNSVALKDEEDKYDLKLFWKIFINICFERKYKYWIYVTNKALQQLRITGINKQMLFTAWILKIRDDYGSSEGQG